MKKIEQTLKNKYGVVLGEKSLAELKQKNAKTKIKVSGRCLKTGKKKTVNLSIKDLI